MSLGFILGLPGSGKTYKLLEEINESLNDNRPLYYLVPEQFSLQAERLILEKKEAVSQLQVLSFNRLCFRLFASLGGPVGKIANDLAKNFIIRKTLIEIEPELSFYKSSFDKTGFIENLASAITEFSHYNITPQDLIISSDKQLLDIKLKDISIIYDQYQRHIKNNYLIPDNMLSLLCKKLDSLNDKPIELLDNAIFWIDGFSGFTPQERDLLKHILKRAHRTTITLTIRNTYEALFTTPLNTLESIKSIAQEIRDDIWLHENKRHKNALKIFANEFNIIGKKSFTNNGIIILKAADTYNAVLATALKIKELRERGIKYKEIAIACTDRRKYEKLLLSVFDRVKIPLFIDTEINILNHPLTELIRSSLEIISFNWQLTAVFSFLKTDLTNISDIDKLENYALARGLNSYKWQYEIQDEALETARKALIESLSFYKKANQTIHEWSRQVFDMLLFLNIPEKLQIWFDEAINNNRPDIARMHKQIWGKVCDIFDKLVEIMGDVKCNSTHFLQLADAGFAETGLGRIPPATDQVILGDVGRSRYPYIKAMIVLGVSEGALPNTNKKHPLFTETEIEKLKNQNIEIAPNGMDKLFDEYFNIYCTFCQPEESLILIYPATDKPSPIIRLLNIQVQDIQPILDYKHLVDIRETPSKIETDIYGKTIQTAVSRLETYVRCPFAYFLQYNIGARERKLYEILPTDLGSLYHDIIAGFTNEMINRDWKSITKNDIGEYVKSYPIKTPMYLDSNRNEYILQKAIQICTMSIWAIVEQIKRGEYKPFWAEKEFYSSEPLILENGREIFISGRIDRVDITPDDKYIRIIDYKSGQTKFSLKEVEMGTQLQLMTYINFLTKEKYSPGGVFYFTTDNPLIKSDIDLDDKVREELLLKQFKLSGLVCDEPDNIKAMGDSTVVPVEINKDASISKKSDIISKQGFLDLAKSVEEKIKYLCTNMSDGIIEPKPIDKQACKYCKFPGICKM